MLIYDSKEMNIYQTIDVFFNIDRLVKSNILPDILKNFYNRIMSSRYPIENEIIPLLALGCVLNILDESTLKSILFCFSKVSFFIILLSLIFISYLKPSFSH